METKEDHLASFAQPRPSRESEPVIGPSERAWLDIRDGFLHWRVWWLLGIGDIRQRYRRSKVGQFWITFSVAIFIAAIGTVYSVLLKQPIATYLPYLASTYIVWGLISGIVNDSTSAFVQSENFLRQQAIPKTTFVLRILTRNFVSFAHNVIVLPFVFLIFGIAPSWTWVAALGGVVLIAIAGYLAGLIFAILSTRFRDLPQIIQNFIQIAFFVSPVTWQVTLLEPHLRQYVYLNPFAAFLRVVSEPLMGRLPEPITYVSAFGTIVVLGAVAWPLFRRYRQRIVYWL